MTYKHVMHGLGTLVSHVKAEQDNVPVLHHVILALQAHQPLLLGRRMRPASHQIVVTYDLGTDKSPLKVGMDFPAACGAFVPALIVHARTSGSPAVR